MASRTLVEAVILEEEEDLEEEEEEIRDQILDMVHQGLVVL